MTESLLSLGVPLANLRLINWMSIGCALNVANNEQMMTDDSEDNHIIIVE